MSHIFKNEYIAIVILGLCIGFLPGMAQQTEVVDSSQQYADQIIASEKPVLIDFWASWCMPCRLLNPIIKELEKEYGDKVVFMKINTDVHRQIAAYFQVRALPSIFIVHNKRVEKLFQGVQEKSTYKNALDAILSTSSKDTTQTENK